MIEEILSVVVVKSSLFVPPKVLNPVPPLATLSCPVQPSVWVVPEEVMVTLVPFTKVCEVPVNPFIEVMPPPAINCHEAPL